MAKYDDTDGVWRTIGGRRVFIRNGQDLASAMKESGKFKTKKKNETEDEKAKKFNETMDKRQEIIKKLDDETKDLDNYDKYNLAVSKLEQSTDMQPTEKQYWAGVKERYEKEAKSSSTKESYQDYVKRTLENDDYLRENRPNEYYKKMLNENKDASHEITSDDPNRFGDKMKKVNDFNKKEEEASAKRVQERFESERNSKLDNDILEHFSEDYGYDKGDNLKNLKGQIDYMRNPGDSIHKTAERFVEGGGFLVYNDDIKKYLDDNHIKYNEDNFFDKYKQTMADRMEKLYNTEDEKPKSNSITNSLQRKAYQKYLKEHPNSQMTLEEFKKSKK